MSFLTSQINFLQRYFPAYINGAITTIELSIVGVLLGFTLGVLLALMKISKSKILNIIASIYIEIVRGTPMLVQIMIVYFGLKKVIPEQFTILTAPMFLCSLSISLNSAAYIAEIIRSGISSIDKGQMEAARSLGLNHKQAMKKVILPQAIKNILPALVNEFITLIKESSITYTVGVGELMYAGKSISSGIYEPVRPFIYTALVYFIMTFSLSKAMGRLERRLAND
ncbi:MULTISPECIES: amino acid ABC transporter permease [Peptoniphilus]|jgi:amino ABC transporter, permease protein, 3-TM region, his/glu/gln/arg/opine family|uniref:amino acid ABC transporter permease n=1 Tax=Peptoniphilus TaxID=162289 RepID=UPI000289A1FE|nr:MULTISPECIES: amino acid ABC transporter permease [Peptoniphilus]MBS6610312.1 amino acid ABC transporter permease [Peptoniphilus harei]MDU1043661.1 amino acid ABC transporter permease [Peptoniphilus rhinitidis]MDU1954512.1 amino acid ABC transporter permease [Peptoniphilus lacydonensis]MDU2115447.1 amino acid ABC transporter permease [Peptoniphilus lacydonensis]MDU5274991.1 amino acid ABC transporter permease [Peptoniphilus lacydonensis]